MGKHSAPSKDCSPKHKIKPRVSTLPVPANSNIPREDNWSSESLTHPPKESECEPRLQDIQESMIQSQGKVAVNRNQCKDGLGKNN